MSAPWLPETPHDQAMLGALLELRVLGDAFDRMHGIMRGDMQLNQTDLAALRMLVIREQRGEPVSPHELARHLRISTASTTKLLDRLVASGHVERHPHPRDRRARVIALTEASRREFYRHFGARLAAMRGVAGRYDDAELAVIARFLGEIADAVTAPSATSPDAAALSETNEEARWLGPVRAPTS
ncbi:MarR family transcriptional regulator [Microbacterium sp. X-17]|uniref:MarR family winged helix-turn-helix transcriptional regulator n=1 Tax=Microbacterium sp. X-17 TaxID=3144404 RepID=UPI0031F4A90B